MGFLGPFISTLINDTNQFFILVHNRPDMIYCMNLIIKILFELCWFYLLTTTQSMVSINILQIRFLEISNLEIPS